MQIAFPYQIDGRERTAEADEAEHIREMIEQFLFTRAGERVNRPDFGAGIDQLVFGHASPEAAATAGFMIRGGLQTYFGQRIVIEDVEARAEDSLLWITISYTVIRSGLSDRVELTLGDGP